MEEREDADAPYESLGDDEMVLVSYLKSLPADLIAEIQAINGAFQIRKSASQGDEYWANGCPECGALFGDHFLHSEPGGAFFPENAQDASTMKIHHLKHSKVVELDATWSIGQGNELFEAGKHINSGDK